MVSEYNARRQAEADRTNRREVRQPYLRRMFAELFRTNPLAITMKMYPKAANYVDFSRIFSKTHDHDAWKHFFLQNFVTACVQIYLERYLAVDDGMKAKASH